MASRSWIIRALILALLVGICYGIWWMQSYVNPEFVRDAVATAFREQFPDTQVTVESARMRVFGGISVRNLTLTHKNQSTPFFDAPSAIIYHDKEQLSRGRLIIRKIELDSPKLLLERTAEGWSLVGLTRPSTTQEALPTFVISTGEITVVDRRNPKLPPIVLKNANLTLLNDPAPTILNLNGNAIVTMESLPPISVSLQARVNRDNGQLMTRIEIPDLELHPAMIPIVRNWDEAAAQQLSQLTGRLSLKAELVREGDGPLKKDIQIQLKDGTYQSPQLPQRLEQMAINVRLINDKIKVEKATAQLGSIHLECSLEINNAFAPQSDSAQDADSLQSLESRLERAELQVRDLRLDDAFYKAYPYDIVKKIRRMFSPVGNVHMQYKFQRLKTGQWSRRVELKPEKFGITYEKFRYPLSDIAGSVVAIATNEIDNEVQIDLAGTAGGQRVALTGTVSGPGPDPYIALRISGTNLPIDDRLIDAMPGEKYPVAMRKFRAAARGDFEADIRQQRGVNLTENVFKIQVYDGSMSHKQFPVPLEKVAGRVTIYVSATDPTRPQRPGEKLVEMPDTDRVELRDFTARRGQGTVWLKGDNEPIPGTRDRKMRLTIWGKDCPVDDHLRQAIYTLRLGSLWTTFSPRGAITFNVDLGIMDRMTLAPPEGTPPVGPVQPPKSISSIGRLMKRARPDPPKEIEVPFDPVEDLALSINFQGPSVTPDFFPYDLDDFAGQVKYQHSHVRLEHLTAKHGKSRWRLDAGDVRLLDQGRVWANLGRLDITPLNLDPPFLKALPTALAKGLAEIKLRGPAELTMSHMVFLTPPDGPPTALPEMDPVAPAPAPPAPIQARANNIKPVLARGQSEQSSSPAPSQAYKFGSETDSDVYWRGEIRLGGAAFDAGVTCENVVGRLACMGRHFGTHLGPVLGTFWIDSGTVSGQPLEGGKISFASDPQKQDPYHPGQYLPVAVRIPEMHGNLFRGNIGGTARVVLTEPLRYSLDMRVTGVRLEEVARFHQFSPGTRLEGVAQGYLALNGIPDPTSRQVLMEGSGSLDIDQGNMLNLPFLVPLLKAVKLQAPDKTAFEEAHATYTIRGDRLFVDHLDLLGSAISFGGSGSMNLNGEQLRFELYTIWSQTLQKLLATPFGNMSTALSESLLKIDVTRGADGQMHFQPRLVPFVSDPIRAIGERIRQRKQVPPTSN